jgi:hypothetical protein
MARPLRIEYDGTLYHMTSRGNDRKAIFKSIWNDLQAQSLLGVEEFAEGLRHLATEKQQIR